MKAGPGDWHRRVQRYSGAVPQRIACNFHRRLRHAQRIGRLGGQPLFCECSFQGLGPGGMQIGEYNDSQRIGGECIPCFLGLNDPIGIVITPEPSTWIMLVIGAQHCWLAGARRRLEGLRRNFGCQPAAGRRWNRSAARGPCGMKPTRPRPMWPMPKRTNQSCRVSTWHWLRSAARVL